MGPRNHILDWGSRSPYGKGQFWRLSGPLKSIESQCYGALCSKKLVSATSGLWAVATACNAPILVAVTLHCPHEKPIPAMRPFVKIL